MYEIKIEDVYEDFSKDKKNFDAAKLKYYNDSKKLVVVGMKSETAGVAIKEFVVLKPNMYSFLLDDNSKHKNQRMGIKMLLQQEVIMNVKIFCRITNF